MARLTAAGDRFNDRPAPAKLPWSRVAINTFIASIRSIPLHINYCGYRKSACLLSTILSENEWAQMDSNGANRCRTA